MPRLIALSFDDGPHRIHTWNLLERLAAVAVRATFFVIGQHASRCPEILRRIVQEGHEIGNHTWSHSVLTELSDSAIEREIEKTETELESTVGVRSKLFRPPYGAINPSIRALISGTLGLETVLWNVDSLDWKVQDAETITARVVRETKPGSIILLHDTVKATVQAFPSIVCELRKRAFEFCTISDLRRSP